MDLVTTEAFTHKANANRTERFRAHIKEDERLIYEEIALYPSHLI